METMRTGTSFYGGGGGGTSSAQVDQKIEDKAEELQTLINNHVVVSKTQPEDQEVGDIWFVVKTF